MEELSLRDILDILDRRKKIFAVTTSVLFVLALIFVLNWSNYRSTGTVQIEQSFVPTNVTSNSTNPNDAVEELADQRINQIEQKVTSVESLAEIIRKFNLYPGEVDSTPIAILTAKMRKKIKVEFISGNIANPAAAQKQTAEQLSAIAFEVSFDYKDPATTQKVADELVTRFLDEDLKMRRMQAQETSAFLGTQIAALEASMAAQEKAIADFRAKNGESGPNAMIFNQQTAANLTLSIQNLDSEINSNEGNQGALRAQLAIIEPYSRVIADGQLLTTPEIQLKALETQYATLTGQYGPEHPDVVKLRSQIQALKAQIGPAQNNGQLEAQIADTRANLAAAKSTSGPNHPDVVALQKQLDKLEAALAVAKSKKIKIKADEDGDEIKQDADNPAYIQIASQLKTAEAQHKALIIQRDAMVAQQQKYQQSIASDPQIEQDMAKLTRDYDNSQLRYRELKEKKMSADMNEQLEIGRKGQRLVVINPPDIPEDTHPKFILLLLGGIFVSFMGGAGSVAFAEATNQNIYGVQHVAHIVGVMPLVTIPHMRAEREKKASTHYQPYLVTVMAVFGLVKMLFLNGIVKPVKSVIQRLQSSKKRPSSKLE